MEIKISIPYHMQMTLLESSSSPPMKAYKKALQLPDELLKVPTSFLSKLDGFTDVDWGEKERGRHRGGIVNAKRKTELCRNWLNGFWCDSIYWSKVPILNKCHTY